MQSVFIAGSLLFAIETLLVRCILSRVRDCPLKGTFSSAIQSSLICQLSMQRLPMMECGVVNSVGACRLLKKVTISRLTAMVADGQSS